jgi:hypothetical protein
MPHVPAGPLNVPLAAVLTAGDAREPESSFADLGPEQFVAIASPCAPSPPVPRRSPGYSCRSATTPAHAGGGPLVLRSYLLVACPISWHLCRAMDISYSKLCKS